MTVALQSVFPDHLQILIPSFSGIIAGLGYCLDYALKGKKIDSVFTLILHTETQTFS